MVNAGDTYRLFSGAHLWVVISDPQKYPDEVVVVNLTSQRTWQDQSCVLRLGDHPFVRHETVVFYAEAKVTTLATLIDSFTKNRIRLEDPVSADVLQRIKDGALLSNRLKFGIKQILQKQA